MKSKITLLRAILGKLERLEKNVNQNVDQSVDQIPSSTKKGISQESVNPSKSLGAEGGI